MKLITSGIIILICFCSGILVAQIPDRERTALDEQVEEAKYERYYEILLDNSLSEYYKEGTFIVDVKATVSRVLVPKGYELVEPEARPGLESLPGLPVIPPSLRSGNREQDSLRISGFDSGLRLDRIVVKILVDTSYSTEDMDFVEEAVTMLANVDPFRGDDVSIEKKIFPRNERGIIKDAATPQPEQKVERLVTEEPVQPPSTPEGLDWNDPKVLWYVIGALGALLFGLLLFLALRRPESGRQVSELEAAHNLERLVQSKSEQLKTDVEIQDLSSDRLIKYEEDKTYTTNTTISNPKLVADLVSQWIATEEEEGMVKGVRAIFSTDPLLLDILKPHLSDTNYETLRFGISNIESIPANDRAEEANRFRRAIQQTKAVNGEDDNSANLFDFVQQLSDQQLLHLIKGESDEMTAIMLAQVAGERAGYVLQKMDEDRKLSILLKMGKISNIPVSIYKRVASHFSSKALSVSDMKYVAADGVESILATIDSLPISEQDEFVQSIAKKDLNLAKKIRKYFIAFDDIPSVDPNILQRALESKNSEEMVLALTGAGEQVKRAMLDVRPNREQQLILAELAENREVNTYSIETIRKDILMEIRKQLKRG
ncbi:MAG: FliG C-terminal domain-containing protein [Bacteroidota bacterium]